MTTKSATKQQQPAVDETRLAYETHTLAQMLFHQLAVSHGYAAPMAAWPHGADPTAYAASPQIVWDPRVPPVVWA